MKHRLLILGAWFLGTLLTLAITLITYQALLATHNTSAFTANQSLSFFHQKPIVAYASLPNMTSAINGQVLAADARPVTIDNYLSAYRSPLAGFGDFIVATADKHGLDPYLVVAIAQQESNLCKIIPDDSHNCWGWGIHSEGTLKFTSYEDAIQAVMRGLKAEYLDKGYSTPEQIMSKYTPQSNGSWASGVTQFMTELESGNF